MNVKTGKLIMLDSPFVKESLPNKFSLALGKSIKAAREEKGFNQVQLAKTIHKRRASVSQMENGKMMPDVFDLLLIAHSLEKPLMYFIPKFARGVPPADELNEEEQELLLQFRRIWRKEQRRFAVSQVRSVADFENSEEGR